MRVVMDHERNQGRHVEDVSAKNLGYDVTSLDTTSGDLRLIEVKGLAAATGTILLTPNERRVAEDRPDCYWLYVVTDCGRDAGAAGADREPGPVPVARGEEGSALLSERRRHDAADAGPGRAAETTKPRHRRALEADEQGSAVPASAAAQLEELSARGCCLAGSAVSRGSECLGEVQLPGRLPVPAGHRALRQRFSGSRSSPASRGGVSGIRCLAARQIPRRGDDRSTWRKRAEGAAWKYEIAFHQDNQRRPRIRTERVSRGSELAGQDRPNEEDAADPARLTQTYLEQVSVNQRPSAIWPSSSAPSATSTWSRSSSGSRIVQLAARTIPSAVISWSRSPRRRSARGLPGSVASSGPCGSRCRSSSRSICGATRAARRTCGASTSTGERGGRGRARSSSPMGPCV